MPLLHSSLFAHFFSPTPLSEDQNGTTTISIPRFNPPRSFARCQARNRSGSQCRLHSQDPSSGLCRRHALRASKTTDSLDDSLDLSADILAVNDGSYGTTDDITAILSNIVVLVAKGRLSTRRAAVLTDALSLMLRSVVVMDRITESTPPQIIWDAPRPIRDATLLRKPLTMPPRITRACEPDPCPSPCSPIHM